MLTESPPQYIVYTASVEAALLLVLLKVVVVVTCQLFTCNDADGNSCNQTGAAWRQVETSADKKKNGAAGRGLTLTP